MTQTAKEQATYNELDQKIRTETVKPNVTKEIIEEHKRNPIGKHSDALERVLIYLRRNHNQMQGKLIIICTKPHQEWCIGELSGVRGQPPKVTNECFSSRNEAEHGVFLKRLKNLGLWSQ